MESIKRKASPARNNHWHLSLSPLSIMVYTHTHTENQDSIFFYLLFLLNFTLKVFSYVAHYSFLSGPLSEYGVEVKQVSSASERSSFTSQLCQIQVFWPWILA
jgi:hypothetical protein